MNRISTLYHYKPTSYFNRCIDSLQRLSLGLCMAITMNACVSTGQPTPAFLPMVNNVPASVESEIDGEWRISTIGKTIRIEQGRAYAVDDWLHLGILHIQPNMVVIKNITADGMGGFNGEDLPLMGPWHATMAADGGLDVTVAGALAPVSYRLLPVTGGYQGDDDDYIDPDEFDDTDPDERPFPEPPGFPMPIDPIAKVGNTVADIGRNCYEDFKPMGSAMLKYGACQAGLRNFNMLKEAIQARNAEDAKSIFAAAACSPEFNNLITVMRREGFKSLSLGVSGEVSAIIGGSGEAFIASNLDLSKPTFYGSVGGGVGTQAGVSFNGVVSAFYAPADKLSGKGKSFSVSLKAMGGAGGAVGLSSGSSPRCESFSASAGAGAAVNAGSVSSTRTFKLPKLAFIHKPDFSAGCKDVTVKVRNQTGYDIKIIDVDFYDYMNDRWRSKIVKNTKVNKGKSWTKKLRLQKVGGDKTRVKIQYRVKNQGGFIKKWSKVVSRETGAKICKAGTKFYKNLK
jgi:hypothetical protein